MYFICPPRNARTAISPAAFKTQGRLPPSRAHSLATVKQGSVSYTHLVTDRLGALRKEGAKTKRWIKDFLNGFSLPQFQSLVREYVEKLDKIDGKDFDFSKAK